MADTEGAGERNSVKMEHWIHLMVVGVPDAAM